MIPCPSIRIFFTSSFFTGFANTVFFWGGVAIHLFGFGLKMKTVHFWFFVMFEAQNKSYFKIPGLQHFVGNSISHLSLSCNHPRKTQVFFQNHFIPGGGNSNIFFVHPENWGRWTHFDSYFSKGLKLNHQTRFYTFLLKSSFISSWRFSE